MWKKISELSVELSEETVELSVKVGANIESYRLKECATNNEVRSARQRQPLVTSSSSELDIFTRLAVTSSEKYFAVFTESSKFCKIESFAIQHSQKQMVF